VAACIGTGPVDASFRAIDELTHAPAELVEYSINAVTEGIDALGEASVRILAKTEDKRVKAQAHHMPVFHGQAADTDVIVASAKAYLSALNRLMSSFGLHKERVASVEEKKQGSKRTG
jgi:2-isopropylmalate synthase